MADARPLRHRLAAYAISPDARGPEGFRSAALSDDRLRWETAARAGIPIER